MSRSNQINLKAECFFFKFIKGWIKAKRVQKTAAFVDVNDGSTHKNIQIYMRKDLSQKEQNIAYGASVIVSGTLSQTPKGQLEIHAEDVKVVGSLNIHPLSL